MSVAFLLLESLKSCGGDFAMLNRKLLITNFVIAAICVSFCGAASWGQECQIQENPEVREPVVERHLADGNRHGLPMEVFAVVPGTRFLVRLGQDLNTKELHKNQTFQVRTLEPLEAGSGIFLPIGAKIFGHVSRVETAGTTGRAKIWLTFDEIQTRFGRLPIVAEVASVPGDHSIKNGPIADGVIEGRPSGTQKDAAQAAAAGAAMGAVKGVKDKNKKEAVEGAAMAALAAYLEESGRGAEIDLPRGAKLELELERALYLVRE
jgi:hypothetical protein